MLAPQLAVRAAVLGDDHLCRRRVRRFDPDRELQAFLIAPHRFRLRFPRPGRARPVPGTRAACVIEVYRPDEPFVLLYRDAAPGAHFLVGRKGRFVTGASRNRRRSSIAKLSWASSRSTLDTQVHSVFIPHLRRTKRQVQRREQRAAAQRLGHRIDLFKACIGTVAIARWQRQLCPAFCRSFSFMVFNRSFLLIPRRGPQAPGRLLYGMTPHAVPVRPVRRPDLPVLLPERFLNALTLCAAARPGKWLRKRSVNFFAGRSFLSAGRRARPADRRHPAGPLCVLIQN